MHNGDAPREANVYEGSMHVDYFLFLILYQTKYVYFIVFLGLYRRTVNIRIYLWRLYEDQILAYGCAGTQRINTKISNKYSSFSFTSTRSNNVGAAGEKYHKTRNHKFYIKLSTREWWYKQNCFNFSFFMFYYF